MPDKPKKESAAERILRQRKQSGEDDVGAAAGPDRDMEVGAPETPKPLTATERLLQQRQRTGGPKIKPRTVAPQDRNPEAEHALREAQQTASSTLVRTPEDERPQATSELTAAVWTQVQILTAQPSGAKEDTPEPGSEPEVSPARSIAQQLLAVAEARGMMLEQKDVERFFASISGHEVEPT